MRTPIIGLVLVASLATSAPAGAADGASGGADAPSAQSRVDDPDFQAGLRALFPMSPEQEQELRRRGIDAQRIAAPSEVKTLQETKPVSLAPNSTPLRVLTELGAINAIAFVDQTGEPWPIAEIRWPAGFSGQNPPKGSHVMMLEPKAKFERGNLVVRLDGLATPIPLDLAPGDGKAHGTFNAVIPRNGPNAKPTLIDRPLSAGDDALLAALTGVGPAGGVPVRVQGAPVDTRAWRIGDDVYLRTSLNLLSPGYREATRGEGMSAFRLRFTPVLILSDSGSRVRVRLGGSEFDAAGAGEKGRGG